jgi:hypothetical protein
MEALQLSMAPDLRVSEPPLVDRVIDLLAASQSTDVWARGAGRHVLLGLEGRGPFARLTALGGGSFGLAFQKDERGKEWQLFVIDDLPGIVEHALVACTVDRT